MKYNYIPSPEELQSSLKLRSREYFLENSLHGVQYIVDPTRPKWERILWFILTLSSLGATIGIIITIWRKFQTEPTITGLATGTYDMELQFPKVFICYDWDQLNTTLLAASEKDMYKQLYNFSWKTSTLDGLSNYYKDKDDFRETFESIAPNCDAVLDKCEYNGEKFSCGVMFKKVLIPFGVCCKYQALKPITVADSPWQLKFEALTYPLRIFLYSPMDGSPQRAEKPMLEVDKAVLMSFDAYITFSVAAVAYLTRRQRKCHFPSEQKPFHECLLNCTNEQILHRCDCLPWFLKLIDDQQECSVAKYSCVKEAYSSMHKCVCILPCSYVAYVPHKVKYADNSTISSIRMTTWPWSRYKKETRFGYLDLLVSFGGIGGLFLGYSVLTSVELGYYFSLRSYCGAVVDSSRKKHNIRTVHVVEAKRLSSPDIKPIYFQYVD